MENTPPNSIENCFLIEAPIPPKDTEIGAKSKPLPLSSHIEPEKAKFDISNIVEDI